MTITSILAVLVMFICATANALRIAHVENVSAFSAKLLSQDHTQLASTGHIIDDLAREAASFRNTSPKRLRVKFMAFDNEEFDLTLDLNKVITQRTRVFAGVPGAEQEMTVEPSTYSRTIMNEDGTATIATFTLLADGQVDGMVIRDGQIYMVTPISFLEAEAATEVAPAARSKELARIKSLKSQASTGMAIYRLADVNSHAEDGTPYYGCKSFQPGDDLTADEDDHVDTAGPDMSMLSAVSAASAIPGALDAQGRISGAVDDTDVAGNVGRKPLLKLWTDCHATAGTRGKVVHLDLVVDIGAALFFSDSSTTVDVVRVMSRLQSIAGQLNTFYHAQLGVHISLNTVVVRTGPSDEKWNVYARDDPRWANKTLTANEYLGAAQVYRANEAASKRGAAQQFITRHYTSGTVGVAFVGVLCWGQYSVGMSSYTGSGLITLAHEIGHQFAAPHTFDKCVNEDGSLKYTSRTGGIMDYYNNGKLGPESDSDGEVGFHSLCSKPSMCAHLASVFAGKGIITTPIAQCFSDYDYNESTCGDGLVEGEEECDVYGGDTACCVKCKLVAGATCARPGECCTNQCQLKPASTPCGTSGHCGSDGYCKATTCTKTNQFSCALPDASTPCKEKCNLSTNPESSCGYVTNNLSDGLCTVDGAAGYCSAGACLPITYSWKSDEKTCSCFADEQYDLVRNVVCVSSDGRTVASSFCDAATKPPVSVKCCNYEWKTGAFGQCSNTCGKGTYTRPVTCHNKSRGGVTVPNVFCDAATKPATTEACTSDLTCTLHWRCLPSADGDFSNAAECAGSDSVGYTPCTVDCATASQTRVAKCWHRKNNVPMSDSSCLTAKPTLTRTCTAPTTVSNIKLGAASVVAGKTVSVSWCFYGPAQQMKLSLVNTNGTYTSLATSNSTAKSVTITLPISSKRDNALVRFTTVDGATAVSPAFTITSRCPSLSCGANGACDDDLGVCVCTGGWSGEKCGTSPCAAAGCLNGATCSNTGEQAGQCMCTADFTGTRCQQGATCAVDKCKNGGWLTFADNKCASTCTCPTPWTGDKCTQCPLVCTRGSRPNDACTACVCRRGLAGTDCNCRAAYSVLTFNAMPSDLTAFTQLLISDISVLTGIPEDNIEVDVTPRGRRARVLVTLRYCPADSSSKFFVAATLTSMNDMYVAWEDALLVVNSGASILHTGDAAVLSNGVVSATALYDPLCKGDGCPNGPNPFSSGGNDAGMIAGIVIGLLVAILLAVGVYLAYRRRMFCWKDDVKATTGTEMSAPVAAHVAPIAPVAPAAPTGVPPVPSKTAPPPAYGSEHAPAPVYTATSPNAASRPTPAVPARNNPAYAYAPHAQMPPQNVSIAPAQLAVPQDRRPPPPRSPANANV